MKKFIALLLALIMLLALSACGDNAPADEQSTETTPAAGNNVDDSTGDAHAEGTGADSATVLTEEEAAAACEAGTLTPDAYAGYTKAENTGNWHYSNYPNYKDFKADGKLKVAFVSKCSGVWYAPMSEALRETVEAAGYEYMFINTNFDEQFWMDAIKDVIDQNYDAVVMSAIDAAQLPEAVTMLQEAGIAYMTVDVLGTDNYGFYVPHCSWDDYYLHYELGKYVASEIAAENWMEDVADDYSNMMFVIQDRSKIAYIHQRNQAFCDAILESYAIPEDRIVWLNSDASESDDNAPDLSSVVKENADTVDKWLISAGDSASITSTMELLEKVGVDLDNVKFADCFANDMALKVMMEDSEIAACSYGVCLNSAHLGVSIGEVLINLFDNRIPIPAFTGHDLVIADADSVEECYNTIYGE